MLINASVAAARPTFRYLFNATLPELVPEHPWLGAFHGADVSLLFADPTLLSAESRELRGFLERAIGAFVRDPEAGPGWAGVGTARDDVAVLRGTGATLVPTAEVERTCALFEKALAAIEALTG
jgi:acetylcholinesterase